MREILFRGKTIGNEWVCGNLIVIGDCCFINKDMEFNKMVIPETVGQYTGLKDKNGKRIFEGDVVRCGKGRVCKVEYRTTPCVCGFDLSVISGIDCPPPPEWNLFGDLVVIGNIHDNPELLEDT